MTRKWVDPRDGRQWVVTMLPFGHRGAIDVARLPGGKAVSIAFHQPGMLPISTWCDPDRSLEVLTEHEMMDLLDRASRSQRENRFKLRRQVGEGRPTSS